MASRHEPPETCPVCGEDVPPGARACPHCGADEQSGWNAEETIYDGLDLPDEEFDYDDFVAREFGKGPIRNRRRHVWWMVALIITILVVLGLLVL